MTKRTRLELVATLALTGCTPASPPAGSDPTPPPPAETKAEDAEPSAPTPLEPPVQAPEGETITLRAKVDIDDKPGGKKFQGVWLVTEDGNRHVISYRADPWWTDFEGRTVDAVGRPYVPRGQAIMADHFRLEEMEVVDPTPEDPLIKITSERELDGKFIEVDWPKRSKLGGTKAWMFEAKDGTRYWLSDRPEKLPHDEPVTITARIVEPSNFVARPGGPYLWVIEVED